MTELEKDIAAMSHSARVMTFVVGTLEGLIDEGLVEGPKIMTPKGRAGFELLKAQGFKPTTEEIQEAMAALTTPKP